MGIAALVPVALLLLFGGGGSGRRRTPVRRRLYGPDPLQSMAPPLTDDFVIPLRPIEQARTPLASYPDAPLREYQTPLAPRQGEPIEQGPQWNPQEQAPPFAPPDAAFYPPLDPSMYGAPPAPEPIEQAPPAPVGQYDAPPPPQSQWEPVGVQATRQQAARALAEHILSHRGSSRDRTLIRRLQTLLGVRSDGLIGNESLTAIARYGGLTAQEMSALGIER